MRLIVSDGYEDSPHDEVTITVITGSECAENWLLDAMSLVSNLPPEAVTTKGNQNALLNHLSQAIRAAQAGDAAASPRRRRKLPDLEALPERSRATLVRDSLQATGRA